MNMQPFASESPRLAQLQVVDLVPNLQEVKEKTQKMAEEILAKNNFYQVSIGFLTMGLLGVVVDETITTRFLDRIKHFQTEQPDGLPIEDWLTKQGAAGQAWPNGRAVLSLHFQGKADQAKTEAQLLSKLLENDELFVPKKKGQGLASACAAWGAGYLAVYAAEKGDDGLYNQLMKKIQLALAYQTAEYLASSADNKKDNLSNLFWTFGLQIMAATAMRDVDTYLQAIRGMIEVTKSSDILDAVKKLPLKEYRAFLTSIMLNAATQFKNQRECKLLSNLLKDDLPEAAAQDKMFALATLYQQKARPSFTPDSKMTPTKA